MELIAAIDPGVRTGVALLTDGMLELLSVSHDEAVRLARSREIDVLIVERPRVVRGWTRNPDSILVTAIRAGEVIGAADAADVVLVEPSQWSRGSRGKRVKHESAVLAARARGWTLPSRTSQHSRDALGILLWWLTSQPPRRRCSRRCQT